MSCEVPIPITTKPCAFVIIASFHLTFKPYGLVRVEWPGKDTKGPRYPLRGMFRTRFRPWGAKMNDNWHFLK